MDKADYDVIVIGAGPTAENVADRAVKGGLRAAIVKSELVGGECSYFPNWRKGSFLNPFCQLVIKAIRWDSPPCNSNGQALPNILSQARLRVGFTRERFAERLNISLGTLKNWERGRTRPNRQLWKVVARLISSKNDHKQHISG